MKLLADRLRAALSAPGAKALFALLTLLALCLLMTGREQAGDPLEARVARTLSAMEGAGQVSVVIRTREVSGGSGGLLASGGGTVAVAEGADDPLVRMRLTQALCALLGLQASAVSVVSASGGGL